MLQVDILRFNTFCIAQVYIWTNSMDNQVESSKCKALGKHVAILAYSFLKSVKVHVF